MSKVLDLFNCNFEMPIKQAETSAQIPRKRKSCNCDALQSACESIAKQSRVEESESAKLAQEVANLHRTIHDQNHNAKKKLRE
jgi:hypothetical protein